MSSVYSKEELLALGFAHVGEDVRLSRKASIYGAENIWLGNHVRIDDFCVLSGKITLHDYIHLAPYIGMFGGSAGIELDDFSGISTGVRFYAVSDDYTGEAMTGPLVPGMYRKVTEAPVFLGKHVIVGTGTAILPGVVIGDGCSVGAMSLVNRSLDPWGVYAGVPVRRLKERKKDLLELADKFLEEERHK